MFRDVTEGSVWAGARPRNPWGPSSLSKQEAQDLGGGRLLGRTARGGSRLCPGLGGQSDSGQQYPALPMWPVHLGQASLLKDQRRCRGTMGSSQRRDEAFSPSPYFTEGPTAGGCLGQDSVVPLHWGGQQGAIGRWVGTQAGRRPPAMSRCPGGSELPPAGPQHLQPPHLPPEGWP